MNDETPTIGHNAGDEKRPLLQRRITLEQEKRDVQAAVRDLKTEAKSAGFSKEEIRAIELACRRHFETDEARIKRREVEDIAEALGAYADTPLGAAAVERR